ncbi:glycosyltransferase family 39 protein [Glaciihabitans sp. INWT7]|uniref:glycosyltransferase family 39 protein n=1 Tax=Glaciihabitans sp. INWT7 TaxID=2596912 RepID=UPI0016293470|nr:glycosyltransferase family 39 protein [Glaciihabitans sp. INWT7]
MSLATELSDSTPSALSRMWGWRPSFRSGLAVFLGAVATAISASGSSIPSLWGDEAASVLSAERSIPSLFRMLGSVDAVHGTYYLFLHFWVQAFGASPFSVRFPSAIAVGIAVAGVVVLGSRLGGIRVAAFAGIIAVMLPRITYMGEEARGYAMSTAAVVWLTILLLHIVARDRPERRLWAAYAVGLAACGYLFLFSLLIVVAHAVVALSQRRPAILRGWARATLGGILIAGPVIGFGIGESGQIAFLANRDSTNIRTLVVTQWFGNNLLATLAWILIAAAIIAWAVGSRRNRSWFDGADPDPVSGARTPALVPLAATWLLGPPAILLAVNSVHAVYSSRYLSFAVPAAALLIAWLAARIRPRILGIGLLVAVVSASSISYLSERTPFAKNNSDWAQVAQTIQAHARPGQGMLFDEGSRPSRATRLAMRTYPASFEGLTDVALKTPWYDTSNWHDAVVPTTTVASRLDSLYRSTKTVWLVEYRLPGAEADTYDRSMLAAQGFVVVAEYPQHTSVVLELTRP